MVKSIKSVEARKILMIDGTIETGIIVNGSYVLLFDNVRHIDLESPAILDGLPARIDKIADNPVFLSELIYCRNVIPKSTNEAVIAEFNKAIRFRYDARVSAAEFNAWKSQVKKRFNLTELQFKRILTAYANRHGADIRFGTTYKVRDENLNRKSVRGHLGVGLTFLDASLDIDY